jgi:hypothetical protein
MDKEKRRLGYPTPTAEMQDKFLEIAKLLDAQKTSWSEMAETAKALAGERRQELKSLAESDKPSIPLMGLAYQSLNFLTVMQVIARLGEDVSETHKRLAKVEKAVKELKLALKA